MLSKEYNRKANTASDFLRLTYYSGRYTIKKIFNKDEKPHDRETMQKCGKYSMAFKLVYMITEDL